MAGRPEIGLCISFIKVRFFNDIAKNLMKCTFLGFLGSLLQWLAGAGLMGSWRGSSTPAL